MRCKKKCWYSILYIILFLKPKLVFFIFSLFAVNSEVAQIILILFFSFKFKERCQPSFHKGSLTFENAIEDESFLSVVLVTR